MAKIILNGVYDTKSLYDKVLIEFEDSIKEYEIDIDNTYPTFCAIIEKYYFRNSSRAALSIMIKSYNNEHKVILLSAGGGNGLIINFSLGAEDDYVENTSDFFKELGFKEIQ